MRGGPSPLGCFVKSRRYWLMLAALLVVLGGGALGCHLWASWHYREAQRDLDRRLFAEAQQHLAAALKIWPWSADTYLLAARTARRAKDYETANRYLRASARYGGSASAVLLESQLLRAQRGELAQVEMYLVGCVQKDHPDTPDIVEVLIPQYLRTYQLTHAAHCVKKWLELEPDSRQAWLWRARIYERLLNRAESITSYRRVVELDPDNDAARQALAGLLAEGSVQEALQHFELLRQKQGDTAPVLLGLARCRHVLNQPDEARRLLDALLAQQPRSGQALGERGRLAFQFESAPEAEKWYRQAVAAMPFEKELNYGLYQCLERVGKHGEAEEVLARLKRIEEDMNRIRQVTRAIANEPHDPVLRCEAGKILLRNGHESDGVRWLESALEEDPNHPEAHQILADYYERTGDSVRATAHRQFGMHK